jgi:WD40 repeat protein
MVVSPDGRFVVTVAQGTVTVWTGDTLQERRVLDKYSPRNDFDRAPETLVASTAGPFVLIRYRDGTTKLLRLDSSQASTTLNDDAKVVAVAFDGKGRVLTISERGAIRQWLTEAPSAPSQTRQLGATIDAARFSADGSYVLTRSLPDRQVVLQSADGSARSTPLQLQSDYDWELNRDGTVAAVQFGERNVGIWNVLASDRTISGPVTLQSHDNLTRISLSPDGRRLIGTELTGMHIWNLDGSGTSVHLDIGDPLSLYEGYPLPQFEPIGNRVAIGSGSMPRLYPFDFRSAIASLKSSTTACLTPEQRIHLLGESAPAARNANARCERANGR